MPILSGWDSNSPGWELKLTTSNWMGLSHNFWLARWWLAANSQSVTGWASNLQCGWELTTKCVGATKIGIPVLVHELVKNPSCKCARLFIIKFFQLLFVTDLMNIWMHVGMQMSVYPGLYIAPLLSPMLCSCKWNKICLMSPILP